MTKRRARIICTIGPASADRRTIRELIKAGMDVARLNFSHGDHAGHGRVVRAIRAESREAGRPVAILQDLQGIKLRVGPIRDGGVQLKKGSDLMLRPGAGMGDERTLYVSYPLLLRDASRGDRILLDDGLLELRVVDKTRIGLLARVVEGGVIRDRKGVNLPGMKISATTFTDKDRADLAFGAHAGVDFVALSFVRSALDVTAVRRWMQRHRRQVPIIAKIEKPEALDNIGEIIASADGIMIARGDLGVEVSPEEVPLIQKRLIETANRCGKIVITATQMLESMREHLRPTRAEAADIANAVIDGSDALMLSAETASGLHPVESLRMMHRIISCTEQARRIPSAYQRGETSADALADGACRAADDIGARLIAAYTQSGFTAGLLSKLRPDRPVIAFTPNHAVLSRLSLYWGITAHRLRPLETIDRLIAEIEKSLLKDRLVRRGDRIVILAGSPLPTRAKTNFMKLHTIGG